MVKSRLVALLFPGWSKYSGGSYLPFNCSCFIDWNQLVRGTRFLYLDSKFQLVRSYGLLRQSNIFIVNI